MTTTDTDVEILVGPNSVLLPTCSPLSHPRSPTRHPSVRGGP